MRYSSFFLVLTLGCDGPQNPVEDNEEELINRVELSFTSDGGDSSVAVWDDPLGDGNPTIDGVELVSGESYAVSVAFLNTLSDPPEDITEEVLEEADEHQVFMTGASVVGPAAPDSGSALVEHEYADEDPDGLPLGLDNTWIVLAEGEGDFTVTLRHLPVEDGQVSKTDDLAETVAVNGFGGIPGDTDVQVNFSLAVSAALD